MEDTNGFIFAGLVYQPELVQGLQNSTATQIPPTILELKLFSPTAYNFTAHQIAFVMKDEDKKITFEDLEKDTQYICYWIVTNENPYTFTYSTELMNTLNIRTDGRVAKNAN